MARQYQDLLKIRRTAEVVASFIRENQREVTNVYYCEGEPDYDNPGSLRRFASGGTWGGYDRSAWFRAEVSVPAEMAGRDVWLELTTGREGRWNALNPQFLLLVNGRETQGLDTNHQTAVIARAPKEGDILSLDFEAWSGAIPQFHIDGDGTLNNNPSEFKLKTFNVNDKLWKLYFDFIVPLEAAELLDGNEDALAIANGLREAANMIDLREPGSQEFHSSADKCLDYMDTVFYGRICRPDVAKAVAWCVGHTHIDVAWQWTYEHTKRKTERSFSTALSLIDLYPEYIFMSSQPQLYAFAKERRPDMYDRIKKAAEEGRWDPEGGMWVEADCNLSSGEALIRQFVHGKRFFMEEFGVNSRILWLPDVFGYSAALPQICKKCGIDYFMTTKINWNELNKLPADTFVWKGVDGTGILTHFIPARGYVGTNKIRGVNDIFTTYNSVLTPSDVMGGWERYQQKDLNDDFMIAYGYGDGGGGTTREMVEYFRRMEKGIPGCPVTKQTRTLDFFKLIDGDAGENRRLPDWNGELYLEFHRGTYTSIAKNKRNNRKAEFALQGLEALSVMSGHYGPDFEYPAKALDSHWKTVLINQFHDVLPGSSIKEVYDDTDVMYAELFDDAHRRAAECKSLIAETVQRVGDAYLVFNTLGFTRSAYCMAEAPENFSDNVSLYDCDGNETPVQKTCDGKIVFKAADVPGMGWRSFVLGESRRRHEPIKVSDDNRVAENDAIKVEFDKNGFICSLYDKIVGRETVRQGEALNRLETYEDRPYIHDAWDIAPYYSEKRYDVDALIERRLIENGPVRAVFSNRYKYLRSIICQNVIIYKDGKRIDIETEIDWQNEHIMLKAAFPVEVLSDKATYEIQFGAIERPTHYNTTWEHAKFETCAQKWVDLSESGYGVSILNDCKYGHDVHDGTIRLTLLRSATSPCVNADKGRHVFTYSIYPHSGDWRESGTTREAYDLNAPLTAIHAAGRNKQGANVCAGSLANSESPNVNIDVLKRADSGEGYIIRAYEAHGGRGRARVTTQLPVTSAYLCDMLENTISLADFSGGALEFDILPYEIKTFKLI